MADLYFKGVFFQNLNFRKSLISLRTSLQVYLRAASTLVKEVCLPYSCIVPSSREGLEVGILWGSQVQILLELLGGSIL